MLTLSFTMCYTTSEIYIFPTYSFQLAKFLENFYCYYNYYNFVFNYPKTRQGTFLCVPLLLFLDQYFKKANRIK